MHTFKNSIAVAALSLSCVLPAQQPTGELRRFHAVTLTFDGPSGLSETGIPNPFTDFRLDVTFRGPSGQARRIPGYFAADGDAAETSAESGCKWRVRFTPDQAGRWVWTARFTTGPKAAIRGGGTATSFDGATGSFVIAPSDKRRPDVRALGILSQGRERFARFSGTGEPFVEVGVNSPENVLAYRDFDGTHDRGGMLPGFLHEFGPHVADFSRLGGGPTWQNGKGQGLLGAISYLAEQGLNSMFALTFTAWGDGDDVWPWRSPLDPWRFDCSKLEQWQRVLEHAMQRGVHVQLGLMETENESFFEIFEATNAAMADSRRLYYREMVARFGHLPALTWNLGEEIGWDPAHGSPYRRPTTDEQRRAFAAHLRSLDAYDHPVIVHSYYHTRISQPHAVFHDLSDPGRPAEDVTGVSLQGPFDPTHSLLARSEDRRANNHANVRYWVERSVAADRPWSVATHEQVPQIWGAVTDGFARDPSHDLTRKDVMWGTFMAGGTGVQHYFGFGFRRTSGDDINAESFRSREELWRQSRIARRFFSERVEVDRMRCADELVSDEFDYCLAERGWIYVVYLRDGGTTDLDVGDTQTRFEVEWFDPLAGGAMQRGSVRTVDGPGVVSLGVPPSRPDQDWVVVVRNTGVVPGTGCAGSGRLVTPADGLRSGQRFEVVMPAGGAGSPWIVIGTRAKQAVGSGCRNGCVVGVGPVLAAAPADRWEFDVPRDPALVGGRVRLQGVWVSPGCLELTGAVELEVLR